MCAVNAELFDKDELVRVAMHRNLRVAAAETSRTHDKQMTVTTACATPIPCRLGPSDFSRQRHALSSLVDKRAQMIRSRILVVVGAGIPSQQPSGAA